MFSRFFRVEAYTSILFLLWLSNVTVYGYTTFYLSVYQLIDIWVVTTVWLFWIILLWTFVYKFLWGYVFNYLEHSTILMLTVQNQVVSFIRLKVQSSQDCPQPAVNWGFPCHKHFWTIPHKLSVPPVLESNSLEHLIELRKML